MRAFPCTVLVLLAVVAGATAEELGERHRWCWAFEEADGLEVREAAGRTVPGLILNDGRGVTRAAGRSGRALAFSGGDRATRGGAACVQLNGLQDVDWSEGLTVETWVFFTELDRSATYELVSNTEGDRGPGWRLMLGWQSLWLRTGEGGTGKTWGASSKPSVTPVTTSQWYHLAGTYDGTVFRVYVDGVLVGQSAEGLTLPAGRSTIDVGAYRGGYAYGLNGLVDDVRLYDYARSPAEIIATAKLGSE